MVVEKDDIKKAKLVNIMREVGMRLDKCNFKHDIQSAITLVERYRRVFKVFIVDYELLQNYAASKGGDLSCFTRSIKRIIVDENMIY